MPCGDGTGPFGTGPIGRGLGPCGRGLRRVYGWGIGWRGYGWMSGGMWRCGYTPSKEEELSILREEKRNLEEEIEYLKKRIEELEK
jgi:hypothetical protein